MNNRSAALLRQASAILARMDADACPEAEEVLREAFSCLASLSEDEMRALLPSLEVCSVLAAGACGFWERRRALMAAAIAEPAVATSIWHG